MVDETFFPCEQCGYAVRKWSAADTPGSDELGVFGEYPIILLHGFAQSSRTWDKVAREMVQLGQSFGNEVAVYAVDLPGHGESLLGNGIAGDSLEEAYGLDACAKVAEDVSEHLSCTTGFAPLLVGYSMGGRVALHAACRRECAADPLPIGSILLESAGVGPADETQRAAIAERNEDVADLLESAGTEAFADRWEALPLFKSQLSLPADVRAAVRAERMANDPASLAASLRFAGQHNMDDEAEVRRGINWLQARSVKVFYVCGSLDEKYAAIGETVAKRCVMELEKRPGVGHNVHLEDPQWFAGYVVSLAYRAMMNF